MGPTRKIQQMNQQGAMLITLIVSMVVIGIAASGMLYFSSTSTYGEMFANRQQRAYYLAETGINYARYLFNPNTNYTDGPFATPQTFTLSNGTFTVRSYDKAGEPTRLIIESTGQAGSGWLTARQHVYKEIPKAEVSGSTTIIGEDGEPTSLGFNENETTQEDGNPLDSSWIIVEDETADVIVNDEGELEFKGDSGAISLNPDVVDFPTAMENNGDLLGYFLQVKIDISKMSPGDYYMIGISFRVQDEAAQNSYGISFYRSNGNNGPKTWWAKDYFADFLSKLPTTKDNTPNTYAVLWKREGGTFTVLASARMDETYGVLDYVSNKWLLAPWATLVVRVNEKYDSGESGPSSNYIKAYVQHPSVYPQGTINWNFNNFKQVTWTWPSTMTEVVDSTFTSEDFTEGQPEIGVHAFYDSFGKGAQLFSDFSTVIQGLGGGGSQW